MIEIGKSTSKNSQIKNISTTFSAKIGIYQVYNDYLNDLLAKNLLNEKAFEEDSINKNSIPELTYRELKSKKDFDLIIKEAENTRKNLSQYYKVNDLNKKSHLVISLAIEKKEKIPDFLNKTSTEQTIENFAQIDFVELAASNLGLAPQIEEEEAQSESTKIEPIDDMLYRHVSKTFNSVTNNILSVANGKQVKNESKLTLLLKNTLRPNSQIIMFTNAIPYEEPLLNSIKALKVFTRKKIILLNK